MTENQIKRGSPEWYALLAKEPDLRKNLLPLMNDKERETLAFAIANLQKLQGPVNLVAGGGGDDEV